MSEYIYLGFANYDMADGKPVCAAKSCYKAPSSFGADLLIDKAIIKKTIRKVSFDKVVIATCIELTTGAAPFRFIVNLTRFVKTPQGNMETHHRNACFDESDMMDDYLAMHNCSDYY